VLTHLIHFHFRGASETVATEQAKYGWANGAWYGPYYGPGVDATVVLDQATAGWAKGAWYQFYYGAGVNAAVVATPKFPRGGGGKGYRPDDLQEQLLREDEQILDIIASLICKGVI
jgi:hypothetical protein